MKIFNSRAARVAASLAGAVVLSVGVAGTATADSIDPHRDSCDEPYADPDTDDGGGCYYEYDSEAEADEYYDLDDDQKDPDQGDIKHEDEADDPLDAAFGDVTGL